MQANVYNAKNSKTLILTDIESVEIRSFDSCLIINYTNGGFQIIDMVRDKMDVKIVNDPKKIRKNPLTD